MDYKRFISYLYTYVEGEKGVNVGYIRCEQRQGTCRFTLNLQDRQGIEGGHYKVYLYKVDNGSPVGYYLDEMTIHQGSGELRKQTPCKNVWNTNNKIDDFDGVIAVYDKEHMYASQWSDEPIQTRLFLTYSDWLEKKEIVSKPSSGYIKESEGLSLRVAELYQNSGDGKRQYIPDGHEKGGTQERIEEESQSELAEEQHSSPEEFSKEAVGDLSQTIAEEIVEKIADTAGLGDTNRQSGGWNRKSISALTIRLMENRPKLPDFENHEIYDCVRIEPSDIGLLEMGNWKLGINSFLTHGYYNYKYLMLGKLRFQDGVVKAVLGVPGVYNNKEQYIARIFGFDVFVPIKHTNVKTGNFGYWIVELV